MGDTDGSDLHEDNAQRTNILAGAKHAFARKGMAATMAEVAQAAGVSQGLAYRYFASKEQIYRELVEESLEQADRVIAAPTPAHPATAGERLALLITRLVEYRRDHLEIVQLLDQVLSARKAPDDMVALIRQRRARLLRTLRQLIVAGQATGEVSADDPDHLVIAISSCLEGLTRIGLLDPEQFHRRCPDARILLRLVKP